MLVLVTILMLPPDPIAQSLTFPRDARSCRQRDRAHDGGVTGLLILHQGGGNVSLLGLMSTRSP
jgi:hypothetical protein